MFPSLCVRLSIISYLLFTFSECRQQSAEASSQNSRNNHKAFFEPRRLQKEERTNMNKLNVKTAHKRGS